MRWILAFLVAVLYVLHQDIWFWTDARPLVFGSLPIGLFYHAAFTAACSILLWLFVKYAWPAYLESYFFTGAGAPPPARTDADASPRVSNARGEA
jgi:hypothetical protein